MWPSDNRSHQTTVGTWQAYLFTLWLARWSGTQLLLALFSFNQDCNTINACEDRLSESVYLPPLWDCSLFPPTFPTDINIFPLTRRIQASLFEAHWTLESYRLHRLTDHRSVYHHSEEANLASGAMSYSCLYLNPSCGKHGFGNFRTCYNPLMNNNDINNNNIMF